MGEFKVTQATYIEPVLESQPQKTGRSQLQYTRIRPCQILFFLGLDSVVSRPAIIVYLPIGLFQFFTRFFGYETEVPLSHDNGVIAMQPRCSLRVERNFKPPHFLIIKFKTPIRQVLIGIAQWYGTHDDQSNPGRTICLFYSLILLSCTFGPSQ